ncbi:BREX system ATP-binding domain-containing protein [Vulcanisaeta distributa]|uniref:ATPase domain-containing protein n=1 Tax=Vulcanisaeta distributa (strain DSM 14429 / JCM 11212 / NBRC 100878 / IC-017) TaxID=572478 RepID=E1QST1_VULDI|nr:BREX system ATP-binding domain-containing protein [Vulcanisaeta distributa]ADN49598.1 hypothetical protein Vdis_0185 [Vulcanisaeta distributa DSM 14429]
MRTLLPIPSIEDAEHIFDPHGITEELTKYVNLVASGPSGAGVIIGNYGFGKTHVMLHLMSIVRKRFTNSVIIYVNTPGQSILNVYRALMVGVLDGGLLDRAVNGLGTPIRDLVLLLREGGDEARYARQWLLGDPAPQGFRAKYGLPSTRVNDELAVKFMVEVINALTGVGYGPVLIMLDEFEDVITIGPTRKLQYLSQLRVFIDNLPSKTLFMVSSTPAGWDEIVNTYPALARRLSSFIIYLRPFNIDETRQFINEFTRWRGIKIPLSDELVRTIYEFTEGNPGEVVKAVNLILMEFGGVGSLDIARVKELLSRHV